MSNRSNNLSKHSLIRTKLRESLIKTADKIAEKDVITARKSKKKPLDNYDESTTERNQILTENLNSENDI